MFSNLRLAFKYLNFYFHSKTRSGHGTHSPFVFHFITTVLNGTQSSETSADIEDLRRKLRHDKKLLNYSDLGAGSRISTGRKRSIRSIAKHSLKRRKYGELLYRMVREYKPAHVLELGTSLGISTSYLAMGNPKARVVTMEGVEDIANEALKTFAWLNLKNIQLYKGDFDDNLVKVLRDYPSIDFAFIDGNHRMEPTIRYFNTILPHCNADSILIFDDIHWSAEMEKAWQYIKDHASTVCTIDLFFMGLVFFKKEFKEKQHFRIRF